MNALFWLLLPVAAISGWIAATRHFKAKVNQTLPSAYSKNTVNLQKNFIDTEPDNAVDIVLKKVAVTSETVEVHLALGNLYRRNGEVSRAIRFHQNLSEKHALTSFQRESILYELGRDYLSAGLLDRAERIFKDLLTAENFQDESAKALVEVFQQEKDWDAAIKYAEMVERSTKASQRTRLGHYYCEKAEAIKRKSVPEAEALLLQALKIDKACVRANILLGDLNFKSLNYDNALKFYMAAIHQDQLFLSAVFDKVLEVSLLTSQEVNRGGSLSVASIDEDASFSLVTRSLQFCNDRQKTMNYIEQTLIKKPTSSLLEKYLLLTLSESGTEERQMMTFVKDVLLKVNHKNASYKCMSCGLAVHALHWQCPSCLNWSVIKPV